MVVWLPWGKGAGPAVAGVSGVSASADGEVVVDAEVVMDAEGAASTSFEK